MELATFCFFQAGLEWEAVFSGTFTAHLVGGVYSLRNPTS
jgi:hypothetical protein